MRGQVIELKDYRGSRADASFKSSIENNQRRIAEALRIESAGERAARLWFAMSLAWADLTMSMLEDALRLNGMPAGAANQRPHRLELPR